MTYTLVDLLTLAMEPLLLVNAVLDYFNLGCSTEVVSTAMAGKLI